MAARPLCQGYSALMAPMPSPAKHAVPRPSLAELRAEAAEMIMLLMGADEVAPKDRQTAHDLLDQLSRDKEAQVRAALAHAISSYSLLPRPTAQRLAEDISEVAIPVITDSPVLHDEFLEAMVRQMQGDDPRQHAIASRPSVSSRVSHALVEKEDAELAATLLKNEGAEISEHTMEAVITYHERHGDVLKLVAHRKDLTPKTVKRCHLIILDNLVEAEVSQEMQRVLMETYELPADLAEDIVLNAREQMIANRLPADEDNAHEAELLALAELLHNQGELTPTLLFRCACTGDLDFLSAAFQVMCEEEAEAVVFAFYAQGEESFRTLYQKAGLSPYFRYAITAAVKVVTTRKKKGLPMHPEAFVPEIIEKIIRFYRNIGPGTVENVIGQLKREAQRADQRG